MPQVESPAHIRAREGRAPYAARCRREDYGNRYSGGEDQVTGPKIAPKYKELAVERHYTRLLRAPRHWERVRRPPVIEAEAVAAMTRTGVPEFRNRSRYEAQKSGVAPLRTAGRLCRAISTSAAPLKAAVGQ